VRVHLVGPLADVSGYAAVTRELARAFTSLGAAVTIDPVRWGEPVLKLSKAHPANAVPGAHAAPDCVLNIGIPWTFRRRAGTRRPNVGLTMLEVDGIPASWAERCNQMDEVWVPSSFSFKTLTSGGVDPARLRVMPLGVDTKRFRPTGPSLPIPGRRGFVFLAVSEWVARKAFPLLIEAFVREFSTGEDVCLVLKTRSNRPTQGAADGSRQVREEVRRLLARLLGQTPHADHAAPAACPPVILLTDPLPPESMPALYRAADCFVLPTRGEGWNLPAIEALASGLPVITTAWSGHLEYLSDANAFLVRCDGLEPVPDQALREEPVYTGHRWARPNADHVRELMRWVFENHETARATAVQARPALERDYDWLVSGRRMLDRLAELVRWKAGGPGPKRAFGT